MSKHRLLQYGLTLLILFNLNFLLPRALPGDPLLTLINADHTISVLTAQQVQYYRRYYGLDAPWWQQYVQYWRGILTGDLGQSIYFKAPVLPLVLKRMGWTLLLVVPSLLISTILGTVLGSLGAWYRKRPWERVLYGALVLVGELPLFLIGTLLLFGFSVRLQWFPLGGARTHFAQYVGWWDYVKDLARHGALPIATLSLSRLSSSFLLCRNTMIGVLEKPFMHTAYLKGLSGKVRLFKHGLANCLVPIVTRTFTSLGTLLGGAVLIEILFAYPGIGQLLQQAVLAADYPLLQGILLFTSVGVVTANFLGDALCRRLDPRVREE